LPAKAGAKKLVYNFCAVAYSTLGYIHTAEAKAAISVSLLGHTVSAETKAAISVAIIGNTNRAGKTGYTHTAESIDNIRLNNPNRMSIFVYDLNNKLLGEFLSQREAAKYLKVSLSQVQRYLVNGKVLNNKYIIRSSPLS
jgi:group I intron endonuclease